MTETEQKAKVQGRGRKRKYRQFQGPSVDIMECEYKINKLAWEVRLRLLPVYVGITSPQSKNNEANLEGV